jgi:hypothetical protein
MFHTGKNKVLLNFAWRKILIKESLFGAILIEYKLNLSKPGIASAAINNDFISRCAI